MKDVALEEVIVPTTRSKGISRIPTYTFGKSLKILLSKTVNVPLSALPFLRANVYSESDISIIS